MTASGSGGRGGQFGGERRFGRRRSRARVEIEFLTQASVRADHEGGVAVPEHRAGRQGLRGQAVGFQTCRRLGLVAGQECQSGTLVRPSARSNALR